MYEEYLVTNDPNFWDNLTTEQLEANTLPDCTPTFHPFAWFGNEQVAAKAIWFKNYNILMHYHDYCEINIITGGEGTHYFGNEKFHVRKGNVFIVPPHVKHGYYSENCLNVLHIVINPLFLKQITSDFIGVKEFDFLFNYIPTFKLMYNFNFALELEAEDYDNVIKACINILRISPIHDDIFPLRLHITDYPDVANIMLKSSLLQIISIACFCYRKQINTIKNSTVDNEVILNVINYILRNLGSNISIDTLCKKFALSKAGLFRLFKKKLNVTPGEFITQQRINMAKYLLTHTDMTITAIANEVGLYDNSHFTKHFKRIIGSTPKEYRIQYS